MPRQNQIRTTIILLSALNLSSCGGKKEAEETMRVKVPVTITSPAMGSISESMTLTATSSYQRKNIVSAFMQGYVLHIDVAVGDRVQKGQPILVMQTKESHVLSQGTAPDSLKEFSGKVTIPASATGIVTSILRQSGDYVQDGEQLCVISDIGSFAFVLSVPYDYNRFIRIGESCTLLLPDSMHIPSRIEKKLATVDAASQTQNYLIVPTSGVTVPENVIAQVTLPTNQKGNTLTLAKQAVLADEAMQNFWVMELKNDSVAIRVPIIKGIETDTEVEIRSPVFSPGDRFVLTGNYGMEDTASVIIRQ